MKNIQTQEFKSNRHRDRQTDRKPSIHSFTSTHIFVHLNEMKNNLLMLWNEALITGNWTKKKPLGRLNLLFFIESQTGHTRRTRNSNPKVLSMGQRRAGSEARAVEKFVIKLKNSDLIEYILL